MVALPSEQREAFLVNIFCPVQWVEFFEKNNSKELILDHLSKHFIGLGEVLSEIEEQNFFGKTSRMYQVKSLFWNYKDSFLTIGDATHAISPFYAMGMNIWFESCMILDSLLEENANDLSHVIPIFQAHRKADTDAMQELAYENFSNIAVSSSEYYTNIWFLERELYNLFPSILIPEYKRIAFTTHPLSLVQKDIFSQRIFLKKITDPLTGLMKDIYRNNSEMIYHLLVEHKLVGV
jgi:kynurenine 3-monooxygenase